MQPSTSSFYSSELELIRFRKWFCVLAALVVCQTMTLAFQKPETTGNTPKAKGEPADINFITAEELKAKVDKNEPVTIVDLRGPTVYAEASKTIKGSIHTKVRRVDHRLKDLPRDREVVLYCACPSDEAAIIGARNLMTKKFTRVRVLKGGWKAWLEADGQVMPKRTAA
jgi:rhodanese-related sulfurtransferase